MHTVCSSLTIKLGAALCVFPQQFQVFFFVCQWSSACVCLQSPPMPPIPSAALCSSYSCSMSFYHEISLIVPYPPMSVDLCPFFMASLIWFSQTSLLTPGVRNNRNPLASYNSMRLLQGQPEVQRAWTFYILSSLLRVFEKPIRGRLARRILFFPHFFFVSV